MKLLDISPNFLNEELARKICRNITLKREYIKKYNLVGGMTNKAKIDSLLGCATHRELQYLGNAQSISINLPDGLSFPVIVRKDSTYEVVKRVISKHDPSLSNYQLFRPENEEPVQDEQTIDENVAILFLLFSPYVKFRDSYTNTNLDVTINRKLTTATFTSAEIIAQPIRGGVIGAVFSEETTLGNNAYMEIIVNFDNHDPAKKIYFGVFRTGASHQNIAINHLNDTFSVINVSTGKVTKDDREIKNWAEIQAVTNTGSRPYEFTNNSTRIGCLLHNQKIYFYYDGELLKRSGTDINHFGDMNEVSDDLEFIVLSETPATVTIQNSSPPEPPV
jgi:hypothetical protein